jgi:hypothetical protein
MDNKETQVQAFDSEYIFLQEHIFASLVEFRILAVRRN